MHPQLTDKSLVCKEFIEALEQCHASLWKKYTGACNDQKLKLNTCLRQERLDRTAKNRENAKTRSERRKQALDKLHEDDE